MFIEHRSTRSMFFYTYVLHQELRFNNKKHLKNVGPIHYCEPPHAHSPGVASGTVARRLWIKNKLQSVVELEIQNLILFTLRPSNSSGLIRCTRYGRLVIEEKIYQRWIKDMHWWGAWAQRAADHCPCTL